MRGVPGTRKKVYCKACGKDITYQGPLGPKGGGRRSGSAWYCTEHRYGISDEEGEDYEYGTHGKGPRHEPLEDTLSIE